MAEPRLRRVEPTWFRRDAVEVAPDLLGARLRIVGIDGVRRDAVITEVEAYTADDPASHSFRGPTPRNSTMFGPPGHLYVYLIYGMHHCLNMVTGSRGDGQAVLIRASTEVSGPGRLTRMLRVDRSLDGQEAHISIAAAGSAVDHGDVAITPRIGISKAVDWPRRWIWTPPAR